MGLVGVNGAGKTTLLRLLTGLAAPDSGDVQVLGHRLPEAQVAAKRDIGFASEDMRLYRGQTLRWHMDLMARIYPGWDEPYAGDLVKRFELRPEQARSEEHTSELQSLMRNSYAVFCLKKKKKKNRNAKQTKV